MSRSRLGYCTNVHTGQDFQATLAALENCATDVWQQMRLSRPLDVGLWLSATSLQELRQRDAAKRWSEWLARRHLAPYTLNGFPYGDFHQRSVKKLVYQPDWLDPKRFDYTIGLIDLLDVLLPETEYGSISTLPIAWGEPAFGPDKMQAAADNLLRVAEYLRRLEASHGRYICLTLEPEPGCVLSQSTDALAFFDQYLNSESARRYLGVCHDICHAHVMFEPQVDVIRAYRRQGVHIGKVQVSSCIRMKLDANTSLKQRADARAQLQTFAEERYLHQTVVSTDGGTRRFFEDLPLALHCADIDRGSQDWRVHFHVPIYLQKMLQFETARDDICACLNELGSPGPFCHLEVETYAWNVLPADLRLSRLSQGIAMELQWLEAELLSQSTMRQHGPAR